MILDNHLAILDVGHGNSGVLIHDGNCTIIDCGSGPALRNFLHEQEISKINLVIVSHSDRDHIGGLIHLLSDPTISIDVVRVNSDAEKESKLWRDIVHLLGEHRRDGQLDFVIGIDANFEHSVSNVSLRCISPDPEILAYGQGSKLDDGTVITSNTLSAAISVASRAGSLAIFAADIDETSVKYLVRNNFREKTGVLVYPHHGGNHGSCSEAEFIDQLSSTISANVVVFSVARGENQFPKATVVKEVIRAFGSYIMCTQLTKACCSNAESIDDSQIGPLYSSGRGRQRCCSGTVVISITDGSVVYPLQATHSDFVNGSADTPLCK